MGANINNEKLKEPNSMLFCTSKHSNNTSGSKHGRNFVCLDEQLSASEEHLLYETAK
jgi:hypothetical protein